MPITPATKTKITYDADGVITAGEDATTADISESLDRNYLTNAQQVTLGNVSGVNTGDQDLGPYALDTDLDATNATVAAITAGLPGYATDAELALTNANVETISANLVNYALATDLDTTNVNVAALAEDVVTNYTLKTDFDALQTDFNTLVTNLSDPAFAPSTAFESKLTFDSGLTRTGDTITNDTVTNEVGPRMYLGNQNTSDGVPMFVQPAAEDLSNEVTGYGKVVLDTEPVLIMPLVETQLVVKLTDEDVSTAPSVLVIEHDFSGGGSIVPGFGSTLEFRARSTTTSGQTQGAVRTVWSDPTDASQMSNMVFTTVRDSFATDALWLHGDGSLALGTNDGSGEGVFWASGGYQTDGVGVEGQVLRDDGIVFKPARLDVTDLAGQLSSCIAFKTALTDQTLATEQIHFTVPVTVTPLPLTVGQTWRITAWGVMNNGAANTFWAGLRWGGITGVPLVTIPMTSTATVQTDKAWRLEALIMITSLGALGSCHSSATGFNHVGNSAGNFDGVGYVFPSDIIINTTANVNLVFTWLLSNTTGAPHVKTVGAIAELVRR